MAEKPTSNGDIRALAADTAGQLRLLASEAAGVSPEERARRFADVIGRADARVPAMHKPDFYRALREWFPSWSAQETPVATQRAVGPDPRLDDPGFLIERLRELAARDANARKTITHALAATFGLAESSSMPAGSGEIDPQVAEQLVGVLGLRQGQPVDLDTLFSILPTLLEWVFLLDDAAWGVWTDVGVGASTRREMVLKKAVAGAVSKTLKTNEQQLRAGVERSMRFVIELVAQLGKVGQYARDHYQKIDPERIKSAVGPGSTFSRGETKYWQHFSESFPRLDEATQKQINREICKAIDLHLGRT